MNDLGVSWLLMQGKVIVKANREDPASCVLQALPLPFLPFATNMFLHPRAIERA